MGIGSLGQMDIVFSLGNLGQVLHSGWDQSLVPHVRLHLWVIPTNTWLSSNSYPAKLNSPGYQGQKPVSRLGSSGISP
jgi:hypothetical protein